MFELLLYFTIWYKINVITVEIHNTHFNARPGLPVWFLKELHLLCGLKIFPQKSYIEFNIRGIDIPTSVAVAV